MKYKLNKSLQITIISILIVLISLISFFLYREISQSTNIKQVDILNNYTDYTDIDYEVRLRSNNIYDSNTLGEGMSYISELVDSIDANFTYEFNSDGERDISGNYNIIATVEGNISSGENFETIWEKDFPIIKNKNFSSTNGEVLINEDIRLNLDEYNDFVIEAVDSTGVDFETNLIVKLDIDLDDIEAFEDKTSNIVIPLNTSLFKITINETEEEQGTMTGTTSGENSIDRSKLIIYGIIIGLGVLGLIFMVFFTESDLEKEPFEKELDNIFKKHGDRLVALSSHVDISNSIMVRSIDDLVRIADELNRPILYKFSKDSKEISKFFITNGDEIYVFDLEHYVKGESYAILG